MNDAEQITGERSAPRVQFVKRAGINQRDGGLFAARLKITALQKINAFLSSKAMAFSKNAIA
jgi:hypothetical protein